jgi:hypothetical protein
MPTAAAMAHPSVSTKGQQVENAMWKAAAHDQDTAMPAQRATVDLMPGHRAQQTTHPIPLKSVVRWEPQGQLRELKGSSAVAPGQGAA